MAELFFCSLPRQFAEESEWSDRAEDNSLAKHVHHFSNLFLIATILDFAIRQEGRML